MAAKKIFYVFFILILILASSLVFSEKVELGLYTETGQKRQGLDYTISGTGGHNIELGPLEDADRSTFCDEEGQWYIEITSTAGGSQRTNTFYVSWDAQEDSCTCKGGKWLPRTDIYSAEFYNTGIESGTEYSLINQSATLTALLKNASGGWCCGDDEQDIGSRSVPARYLCYKQDSLRWQDAQDPRFTYQVLSSEDAEFVSQFSEWFRCDRSNIGNVSGTEELHPYFRCIFLDQPRILECCTGSCNNDYPISRQPGSSSSTIEGFEGLLDGFKTIELSSTSSYTFNIEDLDYQPDDWTDYHSLEFEVKFTDSLLPNIITMDSEGAVIDESPIVDFISVQPDLTADRWYLVSIPIRRDIKFLKFYLPQGSEETELNIDNIAIIPKDHKIYYCTGSVPDEDLTNLWLSDLDTDVRGADNISAGRLACEANRVFGWTGTRCCGDDNYINPETYSDQGINNSGCWKGIRIPNKNTLTEVLGESVPGTVVNINGEFYSCIDELEERETDNQGQLTDKRAVPSSNNKNICENIENFFCSSSGSWIGSKYEEGLGDNLVDAPDFFNVPDYRKTGCCADGYGWDGYRCAASPDNEDYELTIIDGISYYYNSTTGTWVEIVKLDWNNNRTGYCNYLHQCLVDPSGNPENNNNASSYHPLSDENPVCIDDQQHIEDHYCEKGHWSTRTRTNFLYLFDQIKDSDSYTIYCDDYSNSLKGFDYTSIYQFILGTEQEEALVPYYTCVDDPSYKLPCLNNFCIARYKENDNAKTMFSVSLNFPIDHQSSGTSFLEEVFDKPYFYCNNLKNTGRHYERCDPENNRLWYSDRLRSIMFSDQGIDIKEEDEEKNIFDIIKDKFNDLIDTVKGWFTTTYPVVERYKNINTMYIQSTGNKKIEAAIIDENNARIQYSGIDVPLCESLEQYRRTHPEVGYIDCIKRNDEIVVSAENIAPVWQQITSSLRID